jgi:hypothetical protein
VDQARRNRRYQHHHLKGKDMTNPIGGLVPDGGVFGPGFDTWWKHLFVGLWFLLIVVAIGALLMAIAKLHKATTNNIPGQADEARSHVMWSGGALLGLAAMGIITTAIFTVAGG